MKNLSELDCYRDSSGEVVAHYGNAGDHTCGVFWVPSMPDGPLLHVVASAGKGWDHVSVSLEDRCPTWEEMETVKRMFFRPQETAMQLHVPVSRHISFHPNCLHLWRPRRAAIPLPPSWMVV